MRRDEDCESDLHAMATADRARCHRGLHRLYAQLWDQHISAYITLREVTS
jgi:hypothetical protein